MTKIGWTLVGVYPSTLDVTSSVLSFNYLQGRQNFSDPYSGNALSVTLNNNSNIAQYFTFDSMWKLSDDICPGGGFPLDKPAQAFYVQGVTYSDAPGNKGISTVTVSLVDIFARNGRNVIENYSMIAEGTFDQLYNLWLNKGVGQINITGGGSSQARAITYSGSLLNYFNLAMATEQGLVAIGYDKMTLISRNSVTSEASGASFTRNASSTTAISYQGFDHIKAGLNFVNTVQTQPEGLAAQTGTNAASVSAFGIVQRSISTIDNTTVQSFNLANWLANSLSDPESETWVINFLDIPQTNTILIKFLYSLYGAGTGLFVNTACKVWDLVYRVPGAGADTTVEVIIQGVGINATPDKTEFTVYFSPLTYYQFFTLDSTTLGILDTSRLGW